MYICLECGKIFAEPKSYIEDHGQCEHHERLLESFSGCPHCRGAYAPATRCSVCNDWIQDDYIKLSDGQCVCRNCYVNMTLEEGS